MVSRPTSSQTKDISNSGGDPFEGDWWEGFKYIRSLGNGCAIQMEMKPNGSIGLPGAGKGLLSPVADFNVNDDGDFTVDLDFDLIYKCGRYRSLCKKGCKAEEKMVVKVTVNVDFLLPEGKGKDGFKECLDSMFSTDAYCANKYKDYLKSLEIPPELLEMMKDPWEWWTKGVPIIGDPDDEPDTELRNGVAKAAAAVLGEMFNDYKVGQLKNLTELCQCAEVTVSQQQQWIKENARMMEEGPLERYQNIFQEYITAAYHDWATKNGGEFVSTEVVSVVFKEDSRGQVNG